MNVKQVREIFARKYHKTENKSIPTIELFGISFLADEPSIFSKPNQDYIQAEIDWYESQSLNVNDIDFVPVPRAWQDVANDKGFVNSNYGNIIYSPNDKLNGMSQYTCALTELSNKYSRRATMIYQRPTMHFDATEQGKNDFVCTNAVTYYIRAKTLRCVVQMRSNDAVLGYKNDYAWQKHVLNKLAKELDLKCNNEIYWQVQNLHVYAKHFKYLEI
ncbi:MAG: putative thymidylate synthase [Prokaryotic dsDNA virus sp.]|nr:MAG: putative thymidylate synthase [Prokaryotic dsDNA virus sp.]